MIKIRLIKLLSHAKKFVFLQVLCQWVSLLCQIAVIFFITDIVQKAFNRGQLGTVLIPYAAAAAACFMLRFISDKLYAAFSHKASADVKITLRTHMYEKLLRMGASYRNAAPTAEIVQLAQDGVNFVCLFIVCKRKGKRRFAFMRTADTVFDRFDYENRQIFTAQVLVNLCTTG